MYKLKISINYISFTLIYNDVVSAAMLIDDISKHLSHTDSEIEYLIEYIGDKKNEDNL